MRIVVDLLIVALAVGHAVDLWLHAEIVPWRRFVNWLEGLQSPFEWLAFLSQCAFCLTSQFAIWFNLFYFLSPDTVVWRWPIYALAIGRMSWLINIATPLADRHGRDPEITINADTGYIEDDREVSEDDPGRSSDTAV